MTYIINYSENEITFGNRIDPKWNNIIGTKLSYKEFNRELNNKQKKLEVSYKLSYSPKHFNILLTANSNTVAARDRGYQHGDGFHFVLAKPKQKNAPSKEFSVLGFSYIDNPKAWGEKFVWYKNVDLSFRKLNKTKYKVYQESGKVYFQVSVPWAEITPLQPFLINKYGINMCYVQAIGKTSKNYYFLKMDERIQSEQSPRQYEVFKFERRRNVKITSITQSISNKMISNSDQLYIDLGINAPQDITINISSNINGKARSRKVKINGGIVKERTIFDVQSLKYGINKINIKVQIGQKTVSKANYEVIKIKRNLIKNFKEFLALLGKTNEVKKDIPTLRFLLENLQTYLRTRKSYDESRIVFDKIKHLEKLLGKIKSKKLLFRSEKEKVFRRAFKSKIDRSLQPYSFRLPSKYNPHKESPLIVFLHGSGDDDRFLNNSNPNLFKIADTFNAIILAPNARGTTHCYTVDNAEKDVIEAIENISDVYSINKSQILLGGFSMGGYGVYRINYHAPKYFKGLLIVSGDPNVGARWHGSKHPDFTKKKYLQTLSNKPIFIFHGKEDRSCPFEKTRKFVNELKKINNEVTFLINSNIGHEMLDNKETQKAINWIKKYRIL